MDVIFQKVLDAVPFQLSLDDGIEEARRQLRDMPRRTDEFPDVTAEDRTLPVGEHGGVGVRIYRPRTDERLPVVMYFHGGGFVLGDLDTHDGTARRHAVGADAVVVSVDYRLAPEHPFPAAVDDAWEATRWVASHADELAIDGARIAVAGDSAGGNLSAVVAQLARDAGSPKVVFQLLWYPVTGHDLTLPSFVEHAEAPILDMNAINDFNRLYAGSADPSDPPATLAPARGNLVGLPPAFVSVAGHDPLRDDGARYAQLMSEAGVSVQCDVVESLPHAFVAYAGVVPAATSATERGLAALRAALHP